MMKTRMVCISIVICVCMVSGVVFAQATTSWPQMTHPSYQPYYGQQPQYLQPPFLPHLPPQTQPPSYYYPAPPQYPVQSQPQSGYWQNEEGMYHYGLCLVRAKRYHEAIRLFQQFLACYPTSTLADNALYWTGECYYAQKSYSTALWYFQSILSRYPKGNKVPDAMLKIALSYFSMKQDTRGCQMLRQLVQQYPKSKPARKASRWFARCGWNYYDRGGYDPCPPEDYGYVSPSYTYGDRSLPKNW